VDDHEGTHLELKPTAAVLHTRRADRRHAAAATEATLDGPAHWPGVFTTRGKEVVELSVIEVGKGGALGRLRSLCAADAVLYAGDDVTDERAFAILDDDAGDVTIKVGPGTTAARHRLRDPDEVARMLAHLVELIRS